MKKAQCCHDNSRIWRRFANFSASHANLCAPSPLPKKLASFVQSHIELGSCMRNAYTRPFFSYYGTPSLPQSPRYKECNVPVSGSCTIHTTNSSGMLSYFCLYYSTDQSLDSLLEIGVCLNRATDPNRGGLLRTYSGTLPRPMSCQSGIPIRCICQAWRK
jgi:hypothetical protein